MNGGRGRNGKLLGRGSQPLVAEGKRDSLSYAALPGGQLAQKLSEVQGELGRLNASVALPASLLPLQMLKDKEFLS